MTAAQLSILLVGQLLPHRVTLSRGQLRGRNGYRFSFAAPLGGALKFSWVTSRRPSVLIASGTASVSNAGSLKLVLRPTRRGRRLAAINDAIKVTVEGAFDPTRGPRAQARRTFVLAP